MSSFENRLRAMLEVRGRLVRLEGRKIEGIGQGTDHQNGQAKGVRDSIDTVDDAIVDVVAEEVDNGN